MLTDKELNLLIAPIADDLLSGAAEVALRAITVLQAVLKSQDDLSEVAIKDVLTKTVQTLIAAQPAMAPLFHLGNKVLLAIEEASSKSAINLACQKTFAEFDKKLCDSVDLIASHVFDLIPAGELVFAYSFSSTVVSSLIYARNRGKYFRVAATEARPAFEGRKFSAMLSDGGIEVIHTFDNALGLLLPNCRVAFMGADCIGNPGIVNKVGSWLLAVSCQKLNIPLYVLAGTEKLVDDERLFEFEKHERPGSEVWENIPEGIRVLNRHFELIPFNLLKGVVTEYGIWTEPDINSHISSQIVHKALQLSSPVYL